MTSLSTTGTRAVASRCPFHRPSPRSPVCSEVDPCAVQTERRRRKRRVSHYDNRGEVSACPSTARCCFALKACSLILVRSASRDQPGGGVPCCSRSRTSTAGRRGAEERRQGSGQGSGKGSGEEVPRSGQETGEKKGGGQGRRQRGEMGKREKRSREAKRSKGVGKKHKKSKKRKRTEEEDNDGEAALASAFRAVKLHDYRRVRRVVSKLRACGSSVDARDGNGWTCLHHACNVNSLAVSRVLLEAGVDANAMDPEGNSPAHFAARHGNVELLEELIYHDRAADMDHPNLRGFTPREIALEAVHARQEADARAAVAAIAAARAEREAEWHRRLCDEAEDAECWWGDDWERGDPFASGGSGMNDDDYAAFVRREMTRRRQAQSDAPAPSTSSTERVRADKAAKAAERSRKILEEEIAKEKALRQATLQVKSNSELHREYERRWQEFLLQEKPAGSVRYGAVPWILPIGASSSHTSVADVVLAPVLGREGADRKKRLRLELLRWHPDKFMARFGRSLFEGDKARILEEVTAISSSLTSIAGR